jgi:hypothetical protein
LRFDTEIYFTHLSALTPPNAAHRHALFSSAVGTFFSAGSSFAQMNTDLDGIAPIALMTV